MKREVQNGKNESQQMAVHQKDIAHQASHDSHEKIQTKGCLGPDFHDNRILATRKLFTSNKASMTSPHAKEAQNTCHVMVCR